MADKNLDKLAQYIMAALYPTYEIMKKGLRSISYEPDNVSEDDIEDFMDRTRLPGAKYAFMSMLLAGDYSFSDSQDERKQQWTAYSTLYTIRLGWKASIRTGKANEAIEDNEDEG